MKINLYFLLIFITPYTLISCTDESAESLGNKTTDFVSRKLLNAKIEVTDSLYTNVLLSAPVIEEYQFTETPYTIFPKGIKLLFQEKGKTKPGYLFADYGKIIEKTGWYEARKNVIIINSNNDTLKTNLIFWDKKNRRIFSNDTVKIYRADGVTSNISTQGIEASEDFKNFKLKNNSGTLPYNIEQK